MLLRPISFHTPEENIFFDDVLLETAERGEGDETLRFWESPVYFIALGRICKEHDDVDLERAQSERIPIVRRSSGGGTVIQGPGCLNFSFILQKSRAKELIQITTSYQYILTRVVNALRQCGVNAGFFPVSDIALLEDQKKISGNAQRRGRHFILHHGTLLYHFDIPLAGRYLKFPKSVPAYRSNRSHENFITNVSCDVSGFQDALGKNFGVRPGLPAISPTEKRALGTKIAGLKPLSTLPQA
jgi:lipoate---protein ligase